MSAATSQQQVDAPGQPAHRSHPGPIRIGGGGPVGAGKTQLIERIPRAMSREISMAAVTSSHIQIALQPCRMRPISKPRWGMNTRNP